VENNSNSYFAIITAIVLSGIAIFRFGAIPQKATFAVTVGSFVVASVPMSTSLAVVKKAAWGSKQCCDEESALVVFDLKLKSSLIGTPRSCPIHLLLKHFVLIGKSFASFPFNGSWTCLGQMRTSQAKSGDRSNRRQTSRILYFFQRFPTLI
jgi:hypothetical protein